jgi:S-formylglutathione hydrolase FrmB
MVCEVRVRVPRSLWHGLVLVGALVAATAGAASLLRSSRSVDEEFTSVALGGFVHARVILPPSYDDSRTRRFPVVYFLHGLPASSTAYRGNTWLEDAVKAAGPAILVLPQGARGSDSDPEYLDWGTGRNWATYVSTELVRTIDRRFRTIPDRSARAIVGLSAGGYGATILGLNHLDRFSVIESWSGYFHPTDPSGTKALARGPLAVAHRLVPDLARDQKRRPTFFGFYVGRGDARFEAENVQLSQELRAAGARYLFELYPGGHETSLWQAHAAQWLGLALARLAKPTTS